MEKLSMCRVCLGSDVRLHSIVGTHLQEMYESLVLIPLETTDGRPVLACYICCARLKNCYELRKSCLQSEELFIQMLSGHESEQVPQREINNKKRLTVHNVVHLSMGHTLDMSADNVGVEALKFEVKLEPDNREDIDEDALEENSVFDNVQSADSGDDFVINIKEEQTGYMTINPTPKASMQDEQRNPEDLTSNNLKHNVLVQDPLQNLSPENSTHNAKKRHQCKMCNKSFSGIQYLAGHMRTHTGLESYHCDLCNEQFLLKEILIEHIRKHYNEKPYQCKICNKQFSSACCRRIHMRTHTGEKPYYCDICKKQFSQKSNFNRHMRTHSGVKLFNCDICKKQFTAKTTLICHQRIHTGEKPYQCYICQKQFGQKVSLRVHIRTHTGDKPHQCHICNKKFSTSSNLNSHMRSNKCEKPNQPDMLCNKRFRKSSYSQIGEKPFQCETCKKRFKVESVLIKHMRTHTGDKPHQCDICKKSFPHLCHLRRHMATHTDKKHV